MELESAQEAFVALVGQIKPESKLKFLEWVHKEYNPVLTPNGGDGVIEEEPEQADLFDQIRDELQKVLPPTAIVTGENQHFPTTSKNTGLDASNTLHVDSFLYPSEEDVDTLCEKLGVSRHYCLQCGSWKTSPLNFISHSASKEQVKYIFQNLVPDLRGKTVMDVGSRLGPVLYGAYMFSQASKIYGIELNPVLCDLQRRVINQFSLSTRLEAVCADVRQAADVIQGADVVVINNVFEYLCSPAEQAEIWEFLFKTVKRRGTVVITQPSIQEACSELTFSTPLHLEQWVTEVDTGIDPKDEELGDIHMYCVT